MRTIHRLLPPLTAAALLFLFTGCSQAFAAGTAIGLAVANGGFTVDHAEVWGSSTLYDGSTVETARTSSQIRLNDAVDVRLAADSRLTVYRTRMILDQGITQVQASPSYAIEARSLTIQPEAAGSVARIRLIGERKVTVAVLGGVLAVRNSGGLLVARVGTGESLDFEPRNDGAVAPTRVAGCLLEKAGKTILADQTAHVVLQLLGADLGKEIGNRVEILGAVAGAAAQATGAEQVIQVASLKEIGKGGCTAIARKVGASVVAGSTAAGAGAAAGGGGATAGGAAAGGAAAGAAASGIGAGTIAVIGGLAAAATLGGLAATGSLPGQSQSPTSASR